MHGMRRVRRRMSRRRYSNESSAQLRSDRRHPLQFQAPRHKVSRTLHHLLQLRDFLSRTNYRRPSVGEKQTTALVDPMTTFQSILVETDVLVIGGGAGGLLAALSAKRHGPRGTRVTLVDSGLIGRCGHTAFSNAWTIVVLPHDDLDGILREIVTGNDGIADQELVRSTLADSYERLRDFEAMGMKFGRDEHGHY